MNECCYESKILICQKCMWAREKQGQLRILNSSLKAISNFLVCCTATFRVSYEITFARFSFDICCWFFNNVLLFA